MSASADRYLRDAEKSGDQKAIQAAALRTRELSLPPELRATNPKVRDLRDAYLGAMRLENPLEVPLEPNGLKALIMITQRSNARAQLRAAAKELESKLKEEQIAWAKDAAKKLLAWTIQEQRVAMSRGRFS